MVFELCQSRQSAPDGLPQHVKLADCILNAGMVIGPSIRELAHARSEGGARATVGRWEAAHGGQERRSDPRHQRLAPAMAARGKTLAKGQTVITGSLIGMNWLTGRHELKGVIDGCGEVAIKLAAA